MLLDRNGINSLNFEYENQGGGVAVKFGTTEAVNLYAYGIEGTHWDFVDGSDQVIVRHDKMSDYDVPSYSQGTFMTTYVTEGSDPDQWTKVAEQNESAEVSEILGFVFDNSSVTSEIAALDNIISKYETSLNTGAQDPDPLLEEMNAEQEQVGIQKVIDEVQRQIDEFLAG